MRDAFRIAHRYLSLTVAALWILQALSGAYLLFHRDIDDWTVGASGRPADPAAIARAIADLEHRPPGGHVIQYFASAGAAGQVDLLVDRPDSDRQVVRIDGATGAPLRESAWEHPRLDVTPSRLVFLFHKEFLAGPLGDAFVGTSGLLLLGNLVMGLRLAWPARGRWRAALWPGRARSPAMAVLGWHRAIALWLAPLGLLTALTGALLAWTPALERATHAAPPPPPACRTAVPGVAFVDSARAERAAVGAFPRAAVAVVTTPSPAQPCYRVQLRQPGELRRVYGTSIAWVDARSGAVLGRWDALSAPWPARLLASLYPIHDGEWAGLATRLVALAIGAWLATTASLGLTLWWTRRQLRMGAKARRG